MLKTLMKKQFLELFQTFYLNRKNGKARSRWNTAILFVLTVLLFVLLGGAFFLMSGGLGSAMLGHGIDWLYFAVTGLIAMALGVFGSVFNTYASVYLPKDNELLLSMPIPARTLLFARLSGVYLTSLLYSALVWIPALVAYLAIVPANARNVIFSVLLTFFIALFVSVLSCALGWVVALISSKAKGKSFLTMFLSLAVMALYYVVYFRVVGSIRDIANHLDELEQAFRSKLHYLYFLGDAADGNAASLLLFILITAALAAVCFLVLTKTFTKLALAENKEKKRALRADGYRAVSAERALYYRELRHFTSVSTWMLNGGFGLLLLPIGAVLAIVKREAIQTGLMLVSLTVPELMPALPVFVTVLVCVVLSMNAILPVSVSMEGKNLWILKSLPVTPWQALRAKERMGVSLGVVPALVFMIAACAVLGFSFSESALACCAVLAYLLLNAEFGLFLDLKHPNFHWTNAAVLTKQSMQVTVSMFGGWIFSAAVGAGGYFLCGRAGTLTTLACVLALFVILTVILRRWLKTSGVRIFAGL